VQNVNILPKPKTSR